MRELKDCLSPDELAQLEESFPSGLAARIVMAMAKEKRFEHLEMDIIRNQTVQVPEELQEKPGDTRKERVVGRDTARLLLKAAECFANANKI